jgi:hypothetical protein
MATREQMASARDPLAGNEQDRQPATAEPAIAPVANVPWTPAGIVYLHHDALAADDRADDAADNWPDSWDGDETTDFDDLPSKPKLSLLRRTIPLLWAAALTIAALQHAGEVERRAALREPSPAELEMHDRAEPEVKAAWRSIGTVTAVAELKPVEPVPEKNPEPIIAQQSVQQTATRDVESKLQEMENRPQADEHPLVEPVTEVVRRDTMSETIDRLANGAAEQPAQDSNDSQESIAATTKAAEVQAKAEDAQVLPPPVSADESTRPSRKGQVTTSHASQPKVAHIGRARARPSRVSSAKYVPLDGHSPRYFTIERPSRGSP